MSAMSSDASSKQGSLEASLAQLDSEKKQVIKEKEEVRVAKHLLGCISYTFQDP